MRRAGPAGREINTVNSPRQHTRIAAGQGASYFVNYRYSMSIVFRFRLIRVLCDAFNYSRLALPWSHIPAFNPLKRTFFLNTIFRKLASRRGFPAR